MHPKLRYLGGAVVRYRMRRQADRFLRDVADPRGAQARVLRELLALNADSDFARRHRFDEIRATADFRRHVPITDYDYHRPYIERVKQGELSALLGARNPLLMFALTSGTTSDSKYIPITRRFLDDYRRGWKVWGIRAYDDHPALHTQDIVQLSSDHDQFRSPGGHPCGNISGLVSTMQSPIVKTMYTVPDVVAKIKAPEAKYYTALRLALANPRVGLVMTANPSTLIQLAKLADARKEELIRDIADGTLSAPSDVAAEVRSSLRRRLGPRNPRRARALEQAVERSGHLFPGDCWPDLSLLAVWTGGSAGAYTSGLKRYFGDVAIRDHGLSASEGRMTIPLGDHRADGLLDVGTHYFEFIPESEYGTSQPTVLEAHELLAGKNYFILLTTSSGLTRYDIRDVVRCTGFEGGTPLLEFLNKGAHISSVTGEKISESQVVEAMKQATTALNMQLSYYTLTPIWGDPPGYRLLIENGDLSSPAAAERLCELADERLRKLNVEYGEKRQTGRLSAVRATLLPPGTWTRFARGRQSRLGGSVEQYKHPCLVPDLEFHAAFLRDFAPQADDRQAAAR
jgi:hypothetical protein